MTGAQGTTATLRERLSEDGFVVLHDVLDPSAIDAHLDRVTPSFNAAVEEARQALELAADLSASAVWRCAAGSVRGREIIRPVFCLDPLQDGARRIVFAPALQALAADWFGTQAAYWNGATSLFPRSASCGEETVHADFAASAAPDPWTDGLRFWCALEDIDPRSGPFFIYRGSHARATPHVMADVLADDTRLAEAMSAQLAADSVSAWFPVFTRLHEAACAAMKRACTALALERVVFTLRKGDVVVFNPGTVHGTALTLDPGRSRRNLTFDLVNPEARIYLPRAWWGTRHDHRNVENRVALQTERTPYGLRVKDWFAALDAAQSRPVVPLGAGA